MKIRLVCFFMLIMKKLVIYKNNYFYCEKITLLTDPPEVIENKISSCDITSSCMFSNCCKFKFISNGGNISADVYVG